MNRKEQVRRFLAGDGVDNRGRTLKEVLAWPNEELESHHDFIQWLFPLEQSSRFNPDAPVLDRQDFRELGQDPQVRTGLRDAFARMLRFYGAEARGSEIVKASAWNAQRLNWTPAPTHNDLRITRMLHSLALFGLHAEATAFFDFLETMLEEERPSGAARTVVLSYWRNALNA